MSLSDEDTEYLKTKIDKALEKKLLNSKTCVVYDQEKEEIQEIKGLIYHKTAEGRILSNIVDKKVGMTFRTKKQNVKSDTAATTVPPDHQPSPRYPRPRVKSPVVETTFTVHASPTAHVPENK